MANKIISVDKAKEIVMRNFSKTYVLRTLLIEKCINALNLSDKEKKDKSPGGIFNASKCRFGNAIDTLIAGGYFEQDENKILRKLKEFKVEEAVQSVLRDNRLENIILEQLKKKSLKRQDLLKQASKVFLEQDKSVTEQVVRSDVGRILSELKKAKKIAEKNGNVSLFSAVKPQPKNEDEILKKAFESLSDEELVDHSVALMEKWFSTHSYTNVKAENTDGPNDNGIDGRVLAKDSFGYDEVILLQVKHLSKKDRYVPLCEVREFAGCLLSENAHKGIFVTNAKYHRDTVKFVKTFKSGYYVLIDGAKWLALAKACGYKIKK